MKENEEKEKNRNAVIAWLDEIEEAKKREKDYRKSGEEILDIYEAEKPAPFNILYSNTETLLPALYSQLPRPVLQRRFHDKDPMGKIVAEAGQRMLEYLLDTDDSSVESFNSVVEDAVLDGLLPGRGVSSVRYDAEIVETDGVESVSSEICFPDSIAWDRVFFGYAKKWTKVPWVAYEEYLDREESEKLFGDLPPLKFTEGEEEEEVEDDKKGKRKTILVYQIWDKGTRTVKYITPQHKDDYLLVQEDPLNLKGFFNCPEPIRFVKKSKNMTPTALYSLYENQAKELNKIQQRLNKVIAAIKVRGVYDPALGDELQNLLKENDNALVPTDQAATLANSGLEKSIWMLPIEKLIVVAQQLYQARESAKQVIYEITGISDIVRGQSKASETLGAQKIKESWGTMRLKRLQGEVQRYALDLIKIMLEIASTKFSEESWKKMTGLPYPTAEEKSRAQEIVAAAQGGEVPPEIAQMAQMPSWAEIIKVLEDDSLRSYRIDIETNSTLDVEATEDKQLVSEFMNAMAQFMNGVTPLVEKGAMSFEVAQKMMMAVVRRYRFGREVEDELQNMKPPSGERMTEEKKKFQQEVEKAGKDLDDRYRKLQLEEAQFAFKKELAAIQHKHKEELAKVKLEVAEEEIKATIDSMMKDHKREIQSMFDKQSAKLEKKRAVI